MHVGEGVGPRDTAEADLESHSNDAIAEKLFIARKTVEAHISQIFLKLDLGESPARWGGRGALP